jgi:hypothetical protein
LSCLTCQSWRPITQADFLMDRRYLSRSVSTCGFHHRQRADGLGSSLDLNQLALDATYVDDKISHR